MPPLIVALCTVQLSPGWTTSPPEIVPVTTPLHSVAAPPWLGDTAAPSPINATTPMASKILRTATYPPSFGVHSVGRTPALPTAQHRTYPRKSSYPGLGRKLTSFRARNAHS